MKPTGSAGGRLDGETRCSPGEGHGRGRGGRPHGHLRPARPRPTAADPPPRQRHPTPRRQPLPPPHPEGAAGTHHPQQPEPPAARAGRAGAGDRRRPPLGTGGGALHRRRHARQPHPADLRPQPAGRRPLHQPARKLPPMGGRARPGHLAQRRRDRRRPPPPVRHRRRLPAPGRPRAADPRRRGQLRPDAHRAAAARLQPCRPQVHGVGGRGRGDLRTRRGLRRPAGHYRQLEQRRAHVRARGRPAGTTRSCTRSSTPWARSSPTAPTTARRATAPTRPTSCATTTTPAARSP
jgi:hypothetical protein